MSSAPISRRPSTTRASWPRRCRCRRLDRVGRHRQPPHARRRSPARRERQGGRCGPRRGSHHGEQEHDPIRPGEADDRLGHPGRDARGHLAWHARGRDEGDRARSSSTGSRRAATRPPRARSGPASPRSPTDSPFRAFPGRARWPTFPPRRRGARRAARSRRRARRRTRRACSRRGPRRRGRPSGRRCGCAHRAGRRT